MVLTKRRQWFTLPGSPVPGNRLGPSQRAGSNPGPRVHPARGPRANSPGGSARERRVHVADARGTAKFPLPIKPLLPRESAGQCQVGPRCWRPTCRRLVGGMGAPVGVERARKVMEAGKRSFPLLLVLLVMLHMGHSCPHVLSPPSLFGIYYFMFFRYLFF